VARVRERYGMGYIIDVLRGSKNQRILLNQHQHLSTYGIGKEYSVEEWRMLGRSLLHQGLMDETSDGYSVLRLNDRSWEILRKQRTVSIAVDLPRSANLTPTDAPNSLADELFNRLRHLRKHLADEQDVPPYVIFSNAALRDMADRRPQTHIQLRSISGVGDRKLAQYGSAFLNEIQAFCQEHSLFTADTSTTAAATTPIPSHLLTWQLFQQGLRPADIAEQRQLRLGTVLTHLAELLEQGYDIEIDRLVRPDRQKKILTALQTIGSESSRRIRDYLGEVYGYDEIRLMQAWWNRNYQESQSLSRKPNR
jgi:ATP-dependent DNA helicase RecQ